MEVPASLLRGPVVLRVLVAVERAAIEIFRKDTTLQGVIKTLSESCSLGAHSTYIINTMNCAPSRHFIYNGLHFTTFNNLPAGRAQADF